MKAPRSGNRLVMDLLAAIQDEGSVGVTRLLALANLTHARLQAMLADFQDHGWAEADGQRMWHITERGQRVLADLRRIDAAMQDHGLGL